MEALGVIMVVMAVEVEVDTMKSQPRTLDSTIIITPSFLKPEARKDSSVEAKDSSGR